MSRYINNNVAARRLLQTVLLAALTIAGCTTVPVNSRKSTLQEPVERLSDTPTQLSRSDLMYKLLLGEIAEMRGNTDVAIESLLAATQSSHDSRVAERTARICLYAQQDDCAKIAVNRWVELAPEDDGANQFAANFAARNGDKQRALSYLRRVIKINESIKSGQGFSVSSALMAKKVDADIGLAILQQLVKEHPKNPHASYAHARLAVHWKKYTLAKQSLQQTLAIDPVFDNAIVLRSTVTTELEGIEKALSELAATIKQYPDIDSIRRAYGRALVSAKRYEAAIKEYELLQSRRPEDADLLYMLGMLTLEVKKLDAAEQYFIRVLQKGQHVNEGNYYLGRIAEERREYKKAIMRYLRISQGEYRVEGQIRMAQMLAKLGRIDQARGHLQQLRSLTQDTALQIRFYLAEASILGEVPLNDAAIDILSQGLLQFPNDQDLLYARAMAAERVGRLDVVEQDFRSILLQAPENVNALNALGYTLADRTDRYQEAYELIEQAMKLKPGSAAITDSYGWVLYRMGRYDEALVYLRKAFSLEADPEIAAHLGEVLWKLGQQQEAGQVWKKAIQASPNHESLLNVMKKFKLQ